MTSAGTAAVAYARRELGKFLYNQQGDRIHPLKSGVTDCSGFVAHVLEEACGFVIPDADRWTGNEDAGLWALGELITLAKDDVFDASDLRDGDLVFFTWWNAGKTGPSPMASSYHLWHHVGLVDATAGAVIHQFGDLPPREVGPDGRTHGHGPNVWPLVNALAKSYRVGVRRLLPDVVTQAAAAEDPSIKSDSSRIVPRPINWRDPVFVRITQEALGVAVDGVRGPATIAATRALQATLGVAIDGVFGGATLRAYLLKRGWFGAGSRGPAVKFVQWIAGDNTPDGIFGPITEGLVDGMRASLGLGAGDGVGAETVKGIVQ